MTLTEPVITTHGPVCGVVVDGGCEFRGIPFAGPIGGERRFRAPVDPTPWTAPLDAVAWPPMVPQPPIDGAPPADAAYFAGLFGGSYVTASSESGLHVNVWTPAADGHLRPVMVWLHGGGFWFGQASRPRENGRLLSVEQDVVVVAPSHRLGGTGYLDTRTVLGGDANVGLRDLVHALTWVRDNVAAFGGDPDNVTLFGESGGAMKAHALLAVPAADGLFHRAICQSGVFPHATLPGGIGPDRARRVLDAVLDAVGGVDGLLTSDADRLSMVRLPPGEVWQPVLDGEVLPVTVPEAMARAAGAAVPLMLGTDRDEMRVLGRMVALPTTRDELRRRLGDGALVEHYAGDTADGTPEFRLAVERALTDAWMRLPTIRLAETRGETGCAPVYLYEQCWHDPARPDVGAGHGLETSLVFGNAEDVAVIRDAPGAAEVSALMRRAWASFARTGTPLVGERPWPPYTPADRLTVAWDVPPRIVADPGGAERERWAGRDLTQNGPEADSADAPT